MRTIAGLEEEEPRLPFSLSPFSSDSAAVFNPHRRSFSYYRLPVHLLKLTVLKLDGSSFGMTKMCLSFIHVFSWYDLNLIFSADVQVPRMASVRELKMAVEEVFDESQKGKTMESISWSGLTVLAWANSSIFFSLDLMWCLVQGSCMGSILLVISRT